MNAPNPEDPPPRVRGAAPASGLTWPRNVGLTLLLALLVSPWLVRRPELPSPRLAAPRLELAGLALTADPAPPEPGAAPQVLARGGTAWLHLEAREGGHLAVLHLHGRGEGAGRVLALATLERGSQALALPLDLALAPDPRGPLDRSSAGEPTAADLLLVLTAEPLEEARILELAGDLGQRGPWLRAVLLRELRAEGVTRPVARVYGLSALLE